MTTIDPRFDSSEGGIGRYTATTVDTFFREGTYGYALHLKNRLDEPELHPSIENGEFTEIFNLGAGWKSPDGEHAEHANGPSQKYNVASQVSVLLNGSKGKATYSGAPYYGLVGFNEYTSTVPADWSTYTASSFKGLHATWDQVDYPTRQMGKRPMLDNAGVPIKDEKGDPISEDTGIWEESSRTRRMPVEIVGGAVTGGAVPSAPSANGQVDVPAMDAQLAAAVRQAAVANPTYDGFLAGITTIDGAVSALAGVLSNPQNYPALREALTT